jgi:hypothetical protein
MRTVYGEREENLPSAFLERTGLYSLTKPASSISILFGASALSLVLFIKLPMLLYLRTLIVACFG